MNTGTESRCEERLAYRWPVWFGGDITEAVYPGLMTDVSSGGIAFTCAVGLCPLEQGQAITVRFSLPRFDEKDPSATVGLTRPGVVRSVVGSGPGVQKVGVQFDSPLSLKPTEQAALACFRNA